MFSSYDKFSKYGVVLRDKTPAGNEVFIQRENTGWRLAEISVNNSVVVEMSCHSNTPEGFFPIEGTAILTLSLDDSFKDCDTFLLDRPVLINTGVWHGLATLSDSARLIVVENREVDIIKKNLKNERNGDYT